MEALVPALMNWLRPAALAAVLSLLGTPTFAAVLDVSSLVHVATVETVGEYDEASLSIWNGQPLSPTNHPSAFQDRLAATWTFYVDPASRNQLWIVASDIQDTNYGFINEPPFDLVALTGFSFSLTVHGLQADPTFSNESATPDEALLGPVSGQRTPLTTTPGWSLSAASGPFSDREFEISTLGVADAFTRFPLVFGTTRIGGGGVFGLTYAPNLDLLARADFLSIEASAFNGNGRYTEAGTLTFAIGPPGHGGVPEPQSWALLVAGFSALGALLRRTRSSRPLEG
jgi:hypothetical protein